MPTTVDEIRAHVRQNDVQFLFAQFVDMHGKPSAKLVPASHLDDLLADGAGFAGYAAGPVGQRPNDPDLIAMPDPASFTVLPWKPEVARLACDLYVDGEPWPYCPRTILRRQLAKAAELGFELKIGAELEYFLLRRADDGTLEIADALDTMEQPCYDMRALTRNLDFVGNISRYLDELGWDNYATDHEDANGQFEQNFAYADALTTCDRAVFFRYMVEALAQERGLIATFMPKPFAHLTGNGCHFHMSLWKDGVNVFDADPADDPNGMGLSSDAYHFIGGLKTHAKAYIALTAPTVNSYKRLVVGSSQRVRLGAGVHQLRPQQPHADAADPGCGAHRGPHGRRLVQPVPRRDRDPRLRPGRHGAGPRAGRPDLRPEPARPRRAPAGRAGDRAAAREPPRRDACPGAR